MYLIVGLGNPGKEYDRTRHNAGFLAIETLTKETLASKKEFEGDYLKTKLVDQNVILLKPMTFMNLSGRSIQKVAAYFKIQKEKIIVLHDDIDLPLGKIRIVKGSSSGGQKGVQSIIDIYGKDFIRIKIGVAQEEKRDTISFVLSPFNKGERKILDGTLLIIPETIGTILTEGLEKAQNKFN